MNSLYPYGRIIHFPLRPAKQSFELMPFIPMLKSMGFSGIFYKKRLDIGITFVILIYVKTAISIPDSLFAAAERLAKQLGISRSELFQRAVRAFIKDHGQDRVTESLNNVYKAGEETGKLDSVLEMMQGTSIAREEW